MNLNDRVAIITGAGSGIGAACAHAFAAKGARVAVVDVNADGARTTAESIDGLAVPCDIADEGAVNAMVAEVEAELGCIDILFNNAGVASGGNPIDTPIPVWESQWQINVMSHIYAIRAVLPGMLQRGGGYVLHTASMAGILSTHGNLTYAATKHAVVGIAEWMAFTYHHRGIRTSLLAPLGVRTPMLGNPTDAATLRTAGPIKEPEEVAQMVVDAIEQERFLILTDPLAQKWMTNKTGDIERWLSGMNRVQQQFEAARRNR